MDVAFPWLHLELTCVTLTSKNAVTPRDQKPSLFMSSLASGIVTALLRLNRSLSRGCSCGSTSRLVQTLPISEVCSGGSRGGARVPRQSLYFQTKMRPEGQKNFFLRPAFPLSQGLDDRPPSPSLSEGLDPPLVCRLRTPSCPCGTNPPFFHNRAWQTGILLTTNALAW